MYESFGLAEICWWFVMFEHQLGVLNEVIEILLDTTGKKSDSHTLNHIEKSYLFDNSNWE